MSLKEGDNTISLLSVMVGSPDSGAYMERRTFGIQTVGIQQGQQPMHLLNNDLWGYQVNKSIHLEFKQKVQYHKLNPVLKY
jgi:extradiol dioxygenase family protein